MSPIEKRLLAALRECVPAELCLIDCTTDAIQLRLQQEGRGLVLRPHPRDGVELEGEIYGDGDVSIDLYRNVSIDSYRVDFLIETPYLARLAIECDGHDFHDRTKQQAAYDRARDRFLLLNGIPTVRFTGSEIHHSAERCAAEIFAIAQRLESVQADLVHGWSLARESHLASESRQDSPIKRLPL